MSDIGIHHKHINPAEFSFGNSVDNETETAKGEVAGKAKLLTEPGTSDTISSAQNTGIVATVVTPTQTIQIPADGAMTIGDYAAILDLSLNNSKATLARGDLGDLLVNAKLATNQIAALLLHELEISALCQKVGDETDAITTATNAAEQPMKDAISSYNSAVANDPSGGDDANQVATVNQAISDYNAGNINQDQFNAIVSNYNNYANGRNSAIADAVITYESAQNNYNNALAVNNSAIDQLNQTISNLNTNLPSDKQLPLAPRQINTTSSENAVYLSNALGSPPLTVPISVVLNPPVTVPPLPDNLVITPPPKTPTSTQLQNSLVAPDLELILNKIGLFNKNLSLHESNSKFYIFTQKGPRLFEKAAFIQHASPIFFNSGGSAGAITGALLTSVTGNPGLSRSVHQGSYLADTTLQQRDLTTRFATEIAHKLGVLSCIKALHSIGAGGVTAENADQVYGTSFGLTYAQAVNEVIHSGTTSQAVSDFVDKGRQRDSDLKDDGLKQDERAKNILTSGVNNTLLQTALLVTGLSLGSPELSYKFNSTLEGSEKINSPLSFPQILQDPNRNLYAKTTLAETLATADPLLSPTQAKQIINTAFKALPPTATAEQYSAALDAQFVSQGLAASTSEALAQQAAAIADGEKNGHALRNDDFFNQHAVATEVANQLAEAGVNSSIAQAAVAQFFNSALVTNTYEYRSQLQQILVDNGVSATVATSVASGTVHALNQPPAPLTKDQLATEVYATIYNNTSSTLGPTVAAELANQGVVALVTGSNSLLKALDDHKGEDQRELARLFNTPSIDLYAFAEQVRDPGHAILHSAHTGLMYKGMPEPQSFKKTLDIPV